jgi:hypothetical protein
MENKLRTLEDGILDNDYYFMNFLKKQINYGEYESGSQNVKSI